MKATAEVDGRIYEAVPVRLGRMIRMGGDYGQSCEGCAAAGISQASLALCRKLPSCLRGRRADRRDVIWREKK